MTTERRRGAELENALLEAAWEELAENGYASFTMDAVAARAATSRPVIYRRWNDRHELVKAAISHTLQRNQVAVPDTGSLRGDILALMRALNATRVQLATVMSVHMAGYYQETGTSLADLRDALSIGGHGSTDLLFTRAAERGEIRLDAVSERMRRLPFDLQLHEFLLTFSSVPDEVLVEIVDTLFLPLVEVPPQPRPRSALSRAAG